MNKPIQIVSSQFWLLLLLLIFLSTCNGQNETILPQTTPELKKPLPKDFDPYFAETTKTATAIGPASITRNIIEARNGDIWLATWEGIMRFDGKTFTNFTNTDSLRRYHVFSAMEDRNGDLWFGTIGAGVYRYNGSTFTNITKKNSLADDKQGCFYQDRSGNIWIGTMGGISVYDGNFYRNFTTKNGLLNNDINSIIEDRSGKIWIASRGGLCTYDGTDFSPFLKEDNELFPDFKNKTGGAFNNVRTLIEDKKGNIWIAGQNGLWRYGDDGLKQFEERFVGYVYEDRAGNIWTSSAYGNSWRLSRYDAEDLENDKATATIILEELGMFFGILEDKDGNIWFGTLNGVVRYDGETFDYFREQ